MISILRDTDPRVYWWLNDTLQRWLCPAFI